jgi:outer membrane protein assembly factor BamB
MTKIIRYIAILGTGLFLSGCVSGPDMAPEWESDVPVEELGSVHIMDNGNRVILGTEKDVHLLDGTDGSTVVALKESFWDLTLRNIEVPTKVGTFFSSDVIAGKYDIVPLHRSGVILLLDFRFDTEIVTALDAQTGEELWQNERYEYSLGKYSRFIEKGASSVGSRLGGLLGADSEEESEEERRERQVEFMKRVFRESPDGELIFFKTFDGLVILKARTGREVGTVEFSGAGLADVVPLDNGDFLVLSGGSNLAGLALATGYHLARVSPSGSLVWRADHSGGNTKNLLITGNTVIVNGGPTEAYDIETGKRLWSNDKVTNGTVYHHLLHDGTALFFGSDLTQTVATIAKSKIWKQDPRSGAVAWETDERRSEVYGMLKHEDSLVVWGYGDFFDDDGWGLIVVNAESGAEMWRTTDLKAGSGMRSATLTANFTVPVVHDNRLYLADRTALYAFDIATGAALATSPYADTPVKRALGVVIHDGTVVLAGTDGVVGYSPDLEQTQFRTEIEKATEISVHDQWLVLTNGAQSAQVVNMTTGNASGVVRYRGSTRYFGDLDGRIFVTDDAEAALSIDNRGTVRRFRF